MLPRGRSILRMANGCSLPISGPDVAHRADIDLRARQEGRGAAQIDGEAAFHPADDRAHYRLVLGEDPFEPRPRLLAPGLVAADHRLAQRVLDPLEKHLDGVADLQGRLAGLVDAEFLDGDTALRSSGRHR